MRLTDLSRLFVDFLVMILGSEIQPMENDPNAGSTGDCEESFHIRLIRIGGHVPLILGQDATAGGLPWLLSRK